MIGDQFLMALCVLLMQWDFILQTLKDESHPIRILGKVTLELMRLENIGKDRGRETIQEAF